ncbi:MAG: FtsW/RodA/SpoVE family cell cycle protein [Clostridia bacterium]
MARRLNLAAMKRSLYRSNTKFLMTLVMTLQVSGMLLLAFKKNPIDLQALVLSAALPLCTCVSVTLYAKWWQIDRALMLLVLLLCSIGLITLEDITRSPITPRNQAYFILAGLAAMGAGIVLIRRLRRWDRYVYWAMAGALVLLVLPLVIGEWQYGAKNWVKVPGTGFSVQPSEFAKPVLILILAAGLGGQKRLLKSLPVVVYAAVLCVLLLIERDLGALLLYFLVTAILFYAGTSNGLLTLAGLGLGGGGAVVAYKLLPYVQKRVEMFQNPWSDPLEKGFQIIQALIAIGSGGLFGMGLGLGYPRNIPLYHSDFIFAAICEEFGLIFALCLLAVYLLIVLRGAAIAMNARSSFHSLTALGVVSLIALQTLVIVGGNIQLIPLTGVTLPFVSAGGSSMISMMGAAGLLLGVSAINAHDEADDYARMQWKGEAQ